MLECVVNVSEGRDRDRLRALSSVVGRGLLDVHTDPDHHRAVLTIAGPDEDVQRAVRRLATAVVGTVDLSGHAGAHPRFGALDVVPFVALDPAPERPPGDPPVWRDGPMPRSVAARDRFAAWATAELGLPCFRYGPERSLPEVRRLAWRGLEPDPGVQRPHPTAGSCRGRRPSHARGLQPVAGDA